MTVLDPEREAQLVAEIQRTQWRVSVPAREYFLERLRYFYIKGRAHYDHRILPPAYAHRILEAIGDVYEAEFPSAPAELNERHLAKLGNLDGSRLLLLKVFLHSLIRFTRAFPEAARRPIDTKRTEPLFTTAAVLWSDDKTFMSVFQAAFDELCSPFDEQQALLEAHGIFDWTKFYPPYWHEFQEHKPRFRPTFFEPPEFYESEPVPRPYYDNYPPSDPDDRRYWTASKRSHDEDQRYELRAWQARKREWEHSQRQAKGRHQHAEELRKIDWEEFEKDAWEDRKAKHTAAHKQVRAATPPWAETFHYTPYHLPVLKDAILKVPQFPLDIPADLWFEACWIVAPWGKGKTNLLRHLVLYLLQQDATIILMDAKGDLINTFRQLNSLKDRLVLFDFDPAHPVGINPFDARHSQEMLMYIFSLFDIEMTGLQRMLFRKLIILLKVIPKANLHTLWEVLFEGTGNYQDAISQLEYRHQVFFRTLYDKHPEIGKRRVEIGNRIDAIMDHPHLGPIFNSPTTTFDMEQLLNSGNVIIINTNLDQLGKEGVELVGRFMLALIYFSARAKPRTKPCYVLIDEAQRIIARDPLISDMVSLLRSSRVSLTFAHQELQQIKNDDVRTALGDCAIKFTNSVGEAAAMAHHFQTKAENLQKMGRGEFAFWTNDTGALKVYTKHHPVFKAEEGAPTTDVETFKDRVAYPLIPEAEYQALKQKMWDTYCYKPEPYKPQEKPKQQKTKPKQDQKTKKQEAPKEPKVDKRTEL